MENMRILAFQVLDTFILIQRPRVDSTEDDMVDNVAVEYKRKCPVF